MRVAPLLLLGLSAVACAKEPAPVTSTPAAAQQVTVTATDFVFQLPTTPVKSGLTQLTLDNAGKELHQAQLFRLTDGKTMADFGAALQAQGPMPTWAVPTGGPNAALPGGTSNATLVLEPGTYAIVCFIPSADGMPHVAKGMVAGLEVQPSDQPAAALPAGDIQMALADYSFTMTPAPTAGTHTFTVTNQAAQPHEAVLVRLEPGATMDPWTDWVKGGMKGALPPGTPFGGLTALAPGEVQNFSVDLAPGTYGLICFAPDATDGQPHLLHGMVMQFTVS